MFCKSFQYIVFLFLFVASILMSCHEDKFIIDMNTEESNIKDKSDGTENGDVLNVNVTLDNMGGRAAEDGNTYARIENYVNPEKLRVLVFDHEDKFLFESKSRWVRQISPKEDELSEWSVSIPLSSYGNDKNDDWDWEAIRERLTTKKFKIAIFANRPDREWNMGILRKDKDTGKDNTNGDYIVPGQGWFGSTGPYWDRTNSVVSATNEEDVKDVFDLHHCQYDPIYHGKNAYTTYVAAFNALGENNYNFYGCIAEDDSKVGNNPWMCATSSWVEWGNSDEDSFKDKWKYRYAKLPTEDYPIPMYGIQEFAPLVGWKKGTTIDLNREGDKAISLLRSVVKLELLIPSSAGIRDDVYLFYSNIYARCEPMDVWTPTDQIWTAAEDHEELCEWTLLKNKRMAKGGDPKDGNNEVNTVSNGGVISAYGILASRDTIQHRLMWLYGVWRLDKNWSFDKYNNCNTYSPDASSYTSLRLDNDFDEFIRKYYADGEQDMEKARKIAKEKAKNKFVRIFNPCIQRNTCIHVRQCPRGPLCHGSNKHYVAYTGERNINDPSNLGQVGNTGNGNPTVIYWAIRDGSKIYGLPIVDYSQISNTSRVSFSKILNDDTKPENFMGDYLSGNVLQGTGNSGDEKDAQGKNKEYPEWPLPLLRNHVYRITLTSGTTTQTRTGESDMNFSVRFEEMHTKDIGFK